MIIVIIGICLAILIAGIIWGIVNKWRDDGPCILTGIGAFLLGAALIAGFFIWVVCGALSTVDNRIEMYQEENAKIEEQISVAVQQYQDYETEIFNDLKPESAVTLVSLYPELKSDSLVQKQLDVYLANNQKIKELKEEKIMGSVTRWWGYFG